MKSTIAIIAFLMIICNIYAQQQPMVKTQNTSITSMKSINADSNNYNKNNSDTSLTLNGANAKRAFMNYQMTPRAIPAKKQKDENKDMIITKDTLVKPK
jgi:hypothetical protein